MEREANGSCPSAHSERRKKQVYYLIKGQSVRVM